MSNDRLVTASQTPGAAEAVDRSFWSDFVTSYLHSISPGATAFDRDEQMLMEYQPAWYGDAQDYRLPNFINAFGALGHVLTDPAQLDADLRPARPRHEPPVALRLVEDAGSLAAARDAQEKFAALFSRGLSALRHARLR